MTRSPANASQLVARHGTSTRRQFLASLGALSLASFTDRASGQTVATPADKPAPKRFIGVFMPHGCARELWQPGPEMDLRYPNCSLASFDSPEQYGSSFKQDILVVDGIDLAAGIESGTVGHDASRVILTGSGAKGKSASVDQFLAVEQGLGAETPHTSLVLAVGSADTALGQCISYASDGTPIPKMIDPLQVFDELFGRPMMPGEEERLRQYRAREKSVLDFVRIELEGLSQHLSHEDRQRLQQHASALREVEKRLHPPERHCRPPEAPDSAQFPRLRAFGGGERYFDTITDEMIDLLAHALACDLTRFSSLFLADLTRSPLNQNLPSDIHFDVAHKYLAQRDGKGGEPESWLRLARQNRYSYSKVARLMQRLKERGILDHTLIYASSDMGDPARHSSRNVPTLLAGGGGGFKLGRYLDLRQNQGLLPNNRILVSICHAFGAPIERFGRSANSETLTGALTPLSG